MGSFNQSCTVSGLPIIPGEKVIAFLLTQSPYPKEHDIGLQGRWVVRSPIMHATYADYGSIESDDTAMKAAWAKGFKLDVVTKPATKRDQAIKRVMTWDNFMQGILYHRVEVQREYRIDMPANAPDLGPPLLVSLCLIRKDVWDVLLKIEIGEVTLKTFAAKVKETHEETNSKKIIKDMRSIAKNLKGEAREKIKRLADDMESVSYYEAQRISVGEYVPFMVGLEEHKRLMEKAWTAQHSADLAYFQYVGYVLACLSYQFRPVSHGLQSPNYGAHAVFAAVVANIARADLLSYEKAGEYE